MNDMPIPVPPSSHPSLPPPLAPGQAVAALLQDPRRILTHCEHHPILPLLVPLLVLSVAGALAYGAVVGSFSGGAQLWRAAVKLAVGLPVAALLCLPSLFVFSSLSGARLRLPQAAAIAASLLGLVTLLMLGFAPVAWVFSVSTNSEAFMGALHILLWTAAAGFGIRLLRAAVVHFGGQPGWVVPAWAAVFLLVSLQMTSALRPLVGTAPTWMPAERRFFVAHWLAEVRLPGEPAGP